MQAAVVRRRCRSLWTLVVLCIGSCCDAQSNVWLKSLPLDSGQATIALGDPPVLRFLAFGKHSFGPDAVYGPDGVELKDALRDTETPIALFQDLRAVVWRFPPQLVGKRIKLVKHQQRDPFWDQLLIVDLHQLGNPISARLVESGEFGESLTDHVRNQRHTSAEIDSERKSLVDPIIPQRVGREIPWQDLESAAYPLDFQKVLLASRNDASPAFAYQNGQWFTTWLSHDLPKWTKEDHWFAPALSVGGELVRPAPLSAVSEFVTTEAGVTLPQWKLRWKFGEASVTQWLFSHRLTSDADPATYVRFQLENAPAGTKLVLGLGRRPNGHYWDDKSRGRTPIPFLTLPPDYRREERTIVDATGNVVLESAEDFELETSGPIEMRVTFEADGEGCVFIRTPQTASKSVAAPFDQEQIETARTDFQESWSRDLRSGAQVKLPSPEWMRRIDIWQSQVAAITRVQYQGAERLSYGAGFYQAYFGPEEGWPVVALAQWGRSAEAKRQAEILLSAESRDKSNVHHQSRNGTAAWYAAEVARLTRDRQWLAKVAPALIENAEWTISARQSTTDGPVPLTRGLLPAHIYGGDVRDPATSLYASLVCFKGLVETAEVFRLLGTDELKHHTERFDREAREFRQRLAKAMDQVVDEKTTPPFLPLALAIPSLENRNEGPYERLTASRFGNYWNLFAPSVLELGISLDKRGRPNAALFDYMAEHGGLWAALPRFNAGLDAAYSIGGLRELQRRSIRDVRYRNQAIAGLNSLFLHAASRNGYTFPEVAGLFPDRLDRAAYERLVREAPWTFGMYDAERYLEGHISFTEPLGAVAGAALWLIRDALVSEGHDENGLPNGELHLLANAPSDWYSDGREIVLERFPTAFGKISLRTRSAIDSEGRISLEYRFEKYPDVPRPQLRFRIAPPGYAPRDEAPAGDELSGAMVFNFRK